MLNLSRTCFVGLPLLIWLTSVLNGVGQQPDATNLPKRGYLIDVPVPLTATASDRILNQLTQVHSDAPQGKRTTVVLRYQSGPEGVSTGDTTKFEDALKLARAMSGPQLRRVRAVCWVENEVKGHSTLPVIAADLLLVGPGGAIANAAVNESTLDKTIALTYESIAERRGLFPPAVVSALVDPALELALVSEVGGEQVLAAGDQLASLRSNGKVLREEVWSAPGAPLQLNTKRLRSARIAAAVADSVETAAEFLDLAELNPLSVKVDARKPQAVMLEIAGPIVSNRVRRWQSNLAATLDRDDINTWLLVLDSAGGSLDNSATLAGWFASPEPPLRTVAGLIRAEARGDAALVALACKPLMMQPEATLGGPGAESISAEDLTRYDELIEQIASQTKRPAALIRGLLDPSQQVYRYTNRKTGRIRYATEADIVRGTANEKEADAQRDKWQRGDVIELQNGLAADQAVSLGLVDGISAGVEETARQIGLSGTPPAVADRGLVRFVERVGRSNTLAFLLLFIGFAALSAEANAPGLSLPGFVAMVCFGLYFWMKFLAGTAEWLELIAFGLGIVCIAIEIFVVPGFGVFGIGGLALTVIGIVLMSQTFVIPQNVYQIQVLTRGVWVALGGAAGMVGGFIAMRVMLPHVPVFRGLVMEAPDNENISESEKLGDYSFLIGQVGTTTTPLRPSGKARFGDQIVQVISDGSAIPAGGSVRVTEVHATKVVVEPLEST
ncbi:MAG: NfeD family protein [Rubripirellula sp.]|nr:NfeD family protein [Rubripirellula sp.]